MAKNLADAPGIVSDVAFPSGKKIVDGFTTCGEAINQDIVQLFQKLMKNKGTIPNGLYDNETNGYQFLDALRYYIEFTVMTDYTHFKRKEILPIGNWNMTTTENRSIPHGLSETEMLTIGNIDVMIYADSIGDYGIQPLNSLGGMWVQNGSVSYVSDENINIYRNPAGDFATLGRHSAASYNRGFITFDYIKDI